MYEILVQQIETKQLSKLLQSFLYFSKNKTSHTVMFETGSTSLLSMGPDRIDNVD